MSGEYCVKINFITCYADTANILRIGFDMTAYTVMESEEEISVCVSTYGGAGNEVFEVYIYPRDVTTQGIHIAELYLPHILMMHITKLFVHWYVELYSTKYIKPSAISCRCS